MTMQFELSIMHQFAGTEIINVLGQILDAFFGMYFIHHFFAPKKVSRLIRKGYDYQWIIAALIMELIVFVGDWISGNNKNLWMSFMFVLPFLFALYYARGSILLKLTICLVMYTIQTSIEFLGATVLHIVQNLGMLSYVRFLCLYFFRRIGMKLILMFLIHMLLKRRIEEPDEKLLWIWRMLASVCIIELIVRFNVGEMGKDADFRDLILQMIIHSFCLCIPMLFYMLIYFIQTTQKEVQMQIIQQRFIDTQDQCIHQLLSMQDSLRKFRHDYNTHLLCIDQLAETGEYEQLHEYLTQLHGFRNGQKLFSTYVEDNKINVILNQAQVQAESKGISFSILAKDFQVYQIKFYDMNLLLANLCNNAIEAAEKTREKKIEMQLQRQRGYLQILIKNSALGNPMKENPEMVTEKPEKELHGFGMKIIRGIVEKYSGMLSIESEEGKMIINVLLADTQVSGEC